MKDAGYWQLHSARIIIVVSICFFFAASAERVCGKDSVPDTDWPRWRGANYDGISTETGWFGGWAKAGPKRLWEASVGTGFSSFAVANGRVFTMGNVKDVDTVFCFDAKTGKEIWKKSYACPVDPNNYEGGPGATPTVDGSFVYTLSKRGHAFCFDAAKGKIIWSKNLVKDFGVKVPGWGFAGSPLVQGKLVILNAGSAGLALEKTTGKLVWHNGKEAAGYATAAPFTMNGKKLVAIFGAKAIVAVQPDTGKEVWRHPWQTSYDVNAATPIVSGDKVFISSGYGKGCAMLRMTKGAEPVVWQNKNMRNHFGSCVLWQGHLYGFDGSRLRCLDARNGKVKWTKKGLGKGTLMVADGKLIILSDKGRLLIASASADGYRALAHAKILKGRCWTVPVLAGGRLYARNAKGDVVCLELKGER